MKYAVIRSGGKQYKVTEGDVLAVERLVEGPKKKVDFNEVLLVVSEGSVLIGKPLLPNVKVRAEVLFHLKGEKIRVARFKAKSRYRKVRGFRASLTKIKIEKIGATKEEKIKEEKKTAKKPSRKAVKTSVKKS